MLSGATEGLFCCKISTLPSNHIGEETIRSLARKVLDELEPRQSGGREGVSTQLRRIALGADHGGFALKEMLRGYLGERGFLMTDCGTHGTESVDYPDFAVAVARQVASGECDVGIVVDGAGIGSCMAANKIAGVRAAMCYDISSASNSREHNHANVLTLGAGLIGEGLARQIVDAWLGTEWGSGRHARRVDMITALEQ